MRTPAFAVAVILATSVLAACKPAQAPTKAYAYPAWGFEASFPAPPKETDTPAEGDNPHAFLTEYQDGSHDFLVWTADVSQKQPDIDQMADAASSILAQQTGSVAGVKAYTATGDGVDGREVSFTKDGRTVATLRFFLVGGRLYQVAARSILGGDDPAVKDFLSSFHTLGGAPAEGSAAPPTNAVANAVAAPP
jgi:hypothetical protein